MTRIASSTEFPESKTENIDRDTNLDGQVGLNVNAMNFGRVSDTVVKNFRIDASTEALMTITYAHHEIHAGSAFRVHISKEMANLASNGTFGIAFTAPAASKRIHLTLAIDHQGEASFDFLEDVTSWTGGATVTPRNANRNVADNSIVTDMVSDPVVTLGTPINLIDEHGGAGKSIGSDSSHDIEWVLGEGLTYYLLVTNQATSTNIANITLDWYEHLDRN